MNTLFIRLEGPLQSWGLRSRWTDRDTALEPTKSGVTGLLAGALGWGRDRDDEIRALADDLIFGVRVDLPGELVRDYQTVFGGAMAANRKIKLNATTREPETIVSPRWYLADASFLVAVQASPERIQQLSHALQHPVWPLFLGRKSCPPSVHPWEGTGNFTGIEDALATWPRSPRATAGPLQAWIDAGPGAGSPRRDQIDTLSRRAYHTRYAQACHVDPPTQEQE